MNQDRRSTFRCVSPSSQEPAILRAGRKDISARIIEESAEGMGVAIESGAVSLKTDDLVHLTTASRRVSAQVVHVKEEESGQRIGLVKLRDLGFAPSTGGAKLRQAGSSFLRFGMALAVLLGMFLGGVVLPIDWSAVGIKNHGAAVSAKVSPTGGRATPSRRLVSEEEQMADSFMKMDDLGSEEFARRVELSPRQQDRIDRIVDETISVMSHLQSGSGAVSAEKRAEMGMQALQASWRQIQMELTAEQQAKWRELAAER
jgi:hypothetical protein